MEHAFSLPKLNLGGFFPSAITPRFLDPIAPPTMPFTSPAWMLPHKPRSIALLDVFKDHELVTTYTVDQKAIYLIGRYPPVCDIVLNHCSISRLHATIIHHTNGAAYLVDLNSCHGTFIDDVRLRALQPTLITHGAVIKFGASSRSYSFKTFESHDQILERVQSRIELEPEDMEVEQNTLMNRGLSYRLGFSIPQTHKAANSQSDDLLAMPLFPVRQMEASTSAGSLIRRTQSEDHTNTGSFVIHPPPPPPAQAKASCLSEPGRKRSRTQSAQALVANGATPQPLAQPQVPPPISDDGDDGIPKRVHFSEQPAEMIPCASLYFSPGLVPSTSTSPEVSFLLAADGKRERDADATHPLSHCTAVTSSKATERSIKEPTH